MAVDTSKSLNELIGDLESDATYSSALVTTCVNLYRKPLKDFTIENLRVMIGQNIGAGIPHPDGCRTAGRESFC